MKLTYGDGWFEYDKVLTEVWTEDRARKAHEGRNLYCVVVGKLEDPYCYLTINDDYIGVSFLDSLLRVYLRHQFSEVEKGVMFLEAVLYWEFRGEEDEVVRADFYDFSTGGELRIEKQDLEKDETRVAEDEGLDVSCNYEDYPEFGGYDAFVQHNRPMPK